MDNFNFNIDLFIEDQERIRRGYTHEEYWGKPSGPPWKEPDPIAAWEEYWEECYGTAKDEDAPQHKPQKKD